MSTKEWWIGILALVFTGIGLIFSMWQTSIENAKENQKTRSIVQDLKEDFEQYKQITDKSLAHLSSKHHEHSAMAGHPITQERILQNQKLLEKMEQVITKDVPQIKAEIMLLRAVTMPKTSPSPVP